jgi:hypothetical protein
MRLRVPDLMARIARLDRLAAGLAKEAGAQRGRRGVLLYGEQRQYLNAVQQALGGVDKARVVLARAVKRLESGPGW